MTLSQRFRAGMLILAKSLRAPNIRFISILIDEKIKKCKWVIFYVFDSNNYGSSRLAIKTNPIFYLYQIR